MHFIAATSIRIGVVSNIVISLNHRLNIINIFGKLNVLVVHQDYQSSWSNIERHLPVLDGSYFFCLGVGRAVELLCYGSIAEFIDWTIIAIRLLLNPSAFRIFQPMKAMIPIGFYD